jgi:hypothetical protein
MPYINVSRFVHPYPHLHIFFLARVRPGPADGVASHDEDSG